MSYKPRHIAITGSFALVLHGLPPSVMAQVPPTPGQVNAALTNAEQDQRTRQQQEARERAAVVNAPAVRAEAIARAEYPALPTEARRFRVDRFALEVPQDLPADLQSAGASALPMDAGAVGAGLSSLAADKLASVGRSVADGVDSGNKNLDEAIGNLAANLVTGGIGAAVGGGSGAATAANVDRSNRQLHPDEKRKLAQLQQGKTPAEQQRLADAACALVMCALDVSSNDPAYADKLASQQRGQQYTAEQD